MIPTPRWNLTDWFENIETQKFSVEVANCTKNFNLLLADPDAPPATLENNDTRVEFILRYEAACLFGHVSAYVGCMRSAHTDDSRIRAMTTTLAQISATRSAIQSQMKPSFRTVPQRLLRH